LSRSDRFASEDALLQARGVARGLDAELLDERAAALKELP